MFKRDNGRLRSDTMNIEVQRVKRNEAEFADILHPAEITCQPRARGTVMKKPFANRNLMMFKWLESSFCASTISSLTEAGHLYLSF